MQTSYAQKPPVGFPGMIADTSFTKDVLSRANPAVVIPYGCFVTPSTNPDKQIKLPTSSGEVAASLGIAIASGSEPVNSLSTTDAQYPIKSAVPVLRHGRVWVISEDAAVAGGSVYVRYAGTGTKGAIRATAVTNEAVALTGARFMSSCGAGGLAIVEVDLI